jgi:hypothetical protein
MNSVLQALTHTPPLAEVALSEQQFNTGGGFDPVRTLLHHMRRALSANGCVSPGPLAQSLRQVNKRCADRAGAHLRGACGVPGIVNRVPCAVWHPGAGQPVWAMITSWC